jgi:hypothetical protein
LPRRIRAEIVWVVLSAGNERGEEARRSAAGFAAGFSSSRVVLGGFRDGFLPYSGDTVKSFFEDLKTEVSPDVIFTHQRTGLPDIDLSRAHLVTWRDQLIVEYEIRSTTAISGCRTCSCPSTARSRRGRSSPARPFSSQRDRR